jgi:hypothetical protein
MSVLLGNLADLEEQDFELERKLSEERRAEVQKRHQVEQTRLAKEKAAALQAALLGEGIVNMEENLKEFEEVWKYASIFSSLKRIVQTGKAPRGT